MYLRIIKIFFFSVFFTLIIIAGHYFSFNTLTQVANSEEIIKKPAKKNVGYLTCSMLSERMRDFLKSHYVYRELDLELSKRTFETFVNFLDPGKLYFTFEDIKEFKRLYYHEGEKEEPIIFNKINNVDCRLINGEKGIYERYKIRLKEATILAENELNEKPNFTKDEYIETDRKKIEWVKSTAELKDRWRKTIKFILLNMKESDDIKKIKKRLLKRYEMIKKDAEARTTDEIYSIFLNAFALSLDPHSSFLTPVDNDQFQIGFSLKFVGIGATLKSVDGYTIVDAIVPGGAAAKDGRLKKNDKIVAVDAGDGSGIQDVIEMDLSKVVQLIRGKEGSHVKLVILRKEVDGKINRFSIILKRAVVHFKDSEAKSEVITQGKYKLGIINLPSFYIDYKGCQESPITCRSSSNDMAREVKKLKAAQVDGILLDLRRNGGGDLSETQKIVGLFIKNPVVTQVEYREKQVRTLESEVKEPLYLGPLAILVSKYTASASEILSGAVQDYGRGIILGDSRTFGKGTVQTVIEVPGSGGRPTDGAIHVTIAKFFRPSGKSNQEKGVLSDIIIPDIIDVMDIGEKENDYALPYTTIKASRDFKPEKDLSNIIQKLNKISTQRVEKSPDFKKILEAIEKAKKDKQAKNTLVSLKENESLVSKDKKTSHSKKDVVKSGVVDLKQMPEEEESSFDFSPKVVQKNDFILKEAGNILVDFIPQINQMQK
ncbi:carboxy terminal-processing peptidase [Spirobacillus cienkowskii]|uniref:PDZ domain-containing protein n=1 Tax=Spirobacillus cienkowskii TaxID=495820 RepID=A0A369KQH4_9BACT|nr:MAG: hypothetical protein DCC88_08245 [Spirobacillus cienkowskii]